MMSTVALEASAAVEDSGVIRIAVIGDSTVCDFDASRGGLQGWGKLLPDYVDPSKIEVVNLARSGRSSHSFLAEGHWDKVLALSPAPDYVLIQFAHNDDISKGPGRATLTGKVPTELKTSGLGSIPEDWYRNNLRTYIRDAKELGAVPILVTSMERRQFRGKVPVRKNLPYAAAALEVGEQEGVAVIDMESYCYELYSELGTAGTETLHFHKGASIDSTHYNETGARVWAEFIVEQLAQTIPELKSGIVLPEIKVIDQLVSPSKQAKLTAPAVKSDKIRIAVVGDSTVCDYDPEKTELCGWGQILPDYLRKSEVEVINLARSGRSSHSFIAEGYWDKVLALSPPPDYVLIQFAHNDDLSKGPGRASFPNEIPEKLPEHGLGSNPRDWYRNNIRTYIEQAREIGAIPVLVTSMERMQFRGKVPARKNQPYAEAAFALGAELGVPVIDLEGYSFKVYSDMGSEKSKNLHFTRDDFSIDGTHYNKTGARVWAEFIIEELARVVPVLKPVIIIPEEYEIDMAMVQAVVVKHRDPLNNDELAKTEPADPMMYSDAFLTEVKARYAMPTNISLPSAGWDRIHYAQVFSRKVVEEWELKKLAQQRDFIWGARPGVVEQGGYGSAYYPSQRDFDQSRMIPDGSTFVRDLEWYQKNQPEWIVYKADRTSSAHGFDYSWGAYMALDITRLDVREYILNTFLVPAIDMGYRAIAFDNVAIHNLHRRAGVFRNGEWVQQYSGEVRDPLFAEAVMDYLIWMKREINARGAAMALNAKVDPRQPEETWELVALADIWLDEGGFSQDSRKGIVDQPWRVRYNVARLKAAEGIYVAANTTGVEFKDIAEDEITWILSNFLLVRGEQSFLSITGDRYTGELLPYPESFNPPVGMPLGDSRKVGRLYMRDYENGFIAVNPSSRDTLTFTPPPGNWTDRFGEKIEGTITLTPRSATILLKVGS